MRASHSLFPSCWPLLAALAIAACAAAQDSQRGGLERLFADAVSEREDLRDAAHRELHARSDIAVAAATKLAAALASTDEKGWPRRARAASAVMRGARARLDAHIAAGGKETDESGRALKRDCESVSALLLPPIRAAVGSADRAVRAEALRDAGSFGRDVADLVPLLASTVANPDEDLAARTNAATALRRMRGVAMDALDELAQALDPKTGAFAAEVTAAIADILHGMALSASATPTEIASTRVEISTEELQTLNSDYARTIVPKLARIVRGNDANACWSAAVALGWLGEAAEGAANDLLAAAAAQEGDVLLNLLWALDQFRWYEPPQTSLPVLLRALELGPAGAREHAARLLARLASKEGDITAAGDVLLRLAGGADRGTAAAALHALGAMEAAARPWAKGIAELLRRNLTDEARVPLLDALTAIEPGRIEDVELLRRLLANSDFWVQHSAMLALFASGRYDETFDEAVLPAVRGADERWGPMAFVDVVPGMKPSKKLAAAFLEMARDSDAALSGEWIPVLKAAGVSTDAMLSFIDDALIDPFHSSSATEAMKAATTIGLDEAAVLRFHLKHLESGNADVREAALSSLGDLQAKAKGAISALWAVQVDELDRADRAAKKDGENARDPSMAALRALRRVGGAEAVVPRLQEEMTRRAGLSKRALFPFLMDLDPDSDATAAVIRSMLASPDSGDRRDAIVALGSLPSFPGRIEALEGLANGDHEAAPAARDVLMKLAPQSLVLENAMSRGLEAKSEHTVVSAVAFFEESTTPPAAFETARLRLLGSRSSWIFDCARSSFERRPQRQSAASADVTALARTAVTHEERLSAVLAAQRTPAPLPAAFFDLAAEWLDWGQPNVSILVLELARRNVARADAVDARLGAFVGGRPGLTKVESGHDEASTWDRELLDASIATVALLGPRAIKAGEMIRDALERNAMNPAWASRALKATSAPPRSRATIITRGKDDGTGTAWGSGVGARPRPEPRPGRFPGGSHRFIVDDGGEKNGQWVEIHFDEGTDGAAVIDFLAYQFDVAASQLITPLPIDSAEVAMWQPKDAAWSSGARLQGSFTLRCGAETITGRFETTNPLRARRAAGGGSESR